MKKLTILIAAMALIASACTKTDVIDNASIGKGIGFSAYTQKPTRAPQTDVVTADFDEFKVSAIGNNALYFDNVTFRKNTVWESNPVYFWPAYPLTFCAYNTPANGTFTRNIDKDAQTITFAPSTVLAEQEDLVAAYAASKIESDAVSTGHSLHLGFTHYLTQVVVKALSSNSNYTVKVGGVKLANLAGEGTYTFSSNTMVANAEMKNSASSSDYSAGFTAKTLNGTATEMMTDGGNGRWYLVPQTVTAWNQGTDKTNTGNGTYLALKVKIISPAGIQIYPATGVGTAWMAVPVPNDLKFAQGKKYNVTVKFFGEDGKGGAGYVDPEAPGDLDGNGNADDDKGKKIIGGVIKFNAEVSAWDTVDVTILL
ncbi:MAG: hypothetical protein SOZ66_06420 [Candidatus Cryptobacteroides sp.]|nr:hypothetical protein [Candidatus Cryptobacteroides sp.]